MQDVSAVNSNRVLARQFAREISVEEMMTVGGGENKTTCDPGDPTGSSCGVSGADPCDLDWLSSW